MLSHFEEKAGPMIIFEDESKGYIVEYDKLKIGNVITDNIALRDGVMHNLLNGSQFTNKGYKMDFRSI